MCLELKQPVFSYESLPGLRIIKTVLAVFICLFVFFLFEYYNPVYAVISCVLLMRASVDESYKAGVDRIIGTILGGAVAILTLEVMSFIGVSIESLWAAFFVAMAVLVCLTITKAFELSSYVGSMAAVVLLIAMISYGHAGDNPVIYISIRVIETIIGIIIAVLVNRYVNPNFERMK